LITEGEASIHDWHTLVRGRRAMNLDLQTTGTSLTGHCPAAGRQILALEATRSILVNPLTAEAPIEDPHGREPFQHPALANVDKLNSRQPQDIIQKEKLARLAVDVGLSEVIRWKPRLVSAE
jgi:hypothetical protein